MNNEEKLDDFADLPAEFRPVAEKYGREMFTLVFNAGMSGQATGVLLTTLRKHQSRHGLEALNVLVTSFNQLSTLWAEGRGWTKEELAQCDRDIQLAFSKKLVVPSPIVVLN